MAGECARLPFKLHAGVWSRGWLVDDVLLGLGHVELRLAADVAPDARGLPQDVGHVAELLLFGAAHRDAGHRELKRLHGLQPVPVASIFEDARVLGVFQQCGEVGRAANDLRA